MKTGRCPCCRRRLIVVDFSHRPRSVTERFPRPVIRRHECGARLAPTHIEELPPIGSRRESA